MFFLQTVILFIVAMLLAYFLAIFLTEQARRFGVKWGVLSHVNHRSSHTVPTPRLGGVGLALGFGVAATLFLGGLWLFPHDRAAVGFNPALVGWVGAGWLLMFTVGLLDDLFDLPPLVKLGLLFVAALIPTLGGAIIFNAAHFLSLSTRAAFLLDVAVTLIWILFFTNGFNFMDGMDGFAGGFARYAATTLFLIVLTAGMRYGSLAELRAEAYLLPILAMACWGFLHWNNPPARVFMGDGGSLSLGYLLAVYVVLGYRGTLGLRLPAISALTVLLPFTFDVVLTIIRRARRGENLLKAHREHLYQRLMRSGMSHREVLKLNYVLFALCGGLAWVGFWGATTLWLWLAAVLAGAVMVGYWRHVLRRERAADKTS